jgi:hypothetical protein
MYSLPKKPTKPVPPGGKDQTSMRPMKPTGGPMPKPTKPRPVSGGPTPKPTITKTMEGQKIKAMQQYMAQKKGKSY